MTSSRISARRLSIAVSVLSVLTACGGAETTADLGQTTAAVEGSIPATTSTVPAPTTSPGPASTVAEMTTVPPETTTTTTMPETTTTATGGEVISNELELLTIVAISAGAGSGEFDITLAGRPDGLERYKVSTAGSDGACNSQILGVRGTAEGTVVTVLVSPDPDVPCGGATFGVAWVHADGRRSDITYRDCSAGITSTQPC